MGPGLKPRRASNSLTGTAAPVTADATITPQNVACTPLSTSPSQRRSIAGQNNRSLLPHNYTLGSRSFVAAMTIEAEKSKKVPDFCDLYKVSHIRKDTEEDWIDPICKERHAKMEALRDQAAQSGNPLTGEEISREILGERKNYVRGFGNGPKPSAYISKSKSGLAYQGKLQKVQDEVDSLCEEARLREEEHARKYEEAQSNNAAMRRELDELKSMMQMQNCGRSTVG